MQRFTFKLDRPGPMPITFATTARDEREARRAADAFAKKYSGTVREIDGKMLELVTR